MKGTAFVFVFFAAGLLQAVVPTISWMGNTGVPFFIGALLYYFLNEGMTLVFMASIVAGIIQDGISGLPMGTSTVFYMISGYIIYCFHTVIYEKDWLTHAVLGAGTNLLYTIFVYAVLVRSGLVRFSLLFIIMRIGGAVVLGAITSPIVYSLVESLYRYLGISREKRRLA